MSGGAECVQAREGCVSCRLDGKGASLTGLGQRAPRPPPLCRLGSRAAGRRGTGRHGDCTHLLEAEAWHLRGGSLRPRAHAPCRKVRSSQENRRCFQRSFQRSEAEYERVTAPRQPQTGGLGADAPRCLAVCAFPYLLAFTTDSIEIRLVVNGNLVHTAVVPQLQLVASRVSRPPWFYLHPSGFGSPELQEVTGERGHPSQAAGQGTATPLVCQGTRKE